MEDQLERDIAAISQISAVPTILRVIAEMTGMGYTLVARVTPERWIACAVHDEIAFGLKVGDELDVATTLCREVRDRLDPIIIEHASDEPAFCQHPTPKLYGFESYIAVPVFRKSGEYFGNICALDPGPRELRPPRILATMRLFAELISLQLDAEAAYAKSEAELREQKLLGEFRDQFISALGHDLRNPLGSIVVGAEVLVHQGVSADARSTIERIRRSAKRIELLVDDLLDLTRGRFGGGIPIERIEIRGLDQALRHVFDELATQSPNRAFRFEVQGSGSFVGDRRRLEQLLSNLLANAVQHGSRDQPIEALVRHDRDSLVLQVKNGGPPIPPEVQARLFQPFYRGAGGVSKGLGLGLYIVSEIAAAHGGTVRVASDASGTTFTVQLPKS